MHKSIATKFEQRGVFLVRDKDGKPKVDYDPNRTQEEKEAYKPIMTKEEWEEHFG